MSRCERCGGGRFGADSLFQLIANAGLGPQKAWLLQPTHRQPPVFERFTCIYARISYIATQIQPLFSLILFAYRLTGTIQFSPL